MKRTKIVLSIIVLVSASLITFKIIDKPKSGEVVTSFTSCGCGSCGGQDVQIENIENTSTGKQRYNQLKEELSEPPSEKACMTMGCSICIEYRLIET